VLEYPSSANLSFILIESYRFQLVIKDRVRLSEKTAKKYGHRIDYGEL
jgi:hypothetical protein